MNGSRLLRRDFLIGTTAALLVGPAQAAKASDIAFDELYGKITVLGMAFSDKVKALAGKPVAMKGFMAPPLKAEADFFVLTAAPMALCPFCSSDADWPAGRARAPRLRHIPAPSDDPIYSRVDDAVARPVRARPAAPDRRLGRVM